METSDPVLRSAPESDDVEVVAADWLARRDAGLSAAEEVEFGQWIAGDARRAAAVRRLEAAWAMLVAPRRAGLAWVVRAALERRARRRRGRRAAGVFAALAVAAGLAVLLVPDFGARPAPEFPGAAGSTAAGEVNPVVVRPDRLSLPDGSTVQLNAAAEVAVEFSAVQRLVVLKRGEAYFAVAKDAARPFHVLADGVMVRAVGTEFSVARRAGGVEVIVTEGRVAVDHAESGVAGPVLVDAGNRLNLAAARREAEAAEPISLGAIAAALAWRDSRIELSGTTLADVLPLFNRRNEYQITVADPALLGRRLSGVFWTNDAEGFARLVAQALDSELRPTALGCELGTAR